MIKGDIKEKRKEKCKANEVISLMSPENLVIEVDEKVEEESRLMVKNCDVISLITPEPHSSIAHSKTKKSIYQRIKEKDGESLAVDLPEHSAEMKRSVVAVTGKFPTDNDPECEYHSEFPTDIDPEYEYYSEYYCEYNYEDDINLVCDGDVNQSTVTIGSDSSQAHMISCKTVDSPMTPYTLSLFKDRHGSDAITLVSTTDAQTNNQSDKCVADVNVTVTADEDISVGVKRKRKKVEKVKLTRELLLDYIHSPSNRLLLQQILLYTPVNVDDLYVDLSTSFNVNRNQLLSLMDALCIFVKQ